MNEPEETAIAVSKSAIASAKADRPRHSKSVLFKFIFTTSSSNLFWASRFSGDVSEGATPDPIPNSEVKPFSADGTAGATLWESRSSPGFFS